ncbi:MAG: hypothetical protein FJW79_12470 [Actinobacteria bacterium]|nr:hypothetical protein [Actinomycetota bacterium]
MSPASAPRLVALWGSEHEVLGEVALESLGPDLVAALSRGRFPKGYRHLDLNEDGALAATDGRSTVMAVVDGHQGFDAARAALQAVTRCVPLLLGSATGAHEPAVRHCLAEASRAVVDELSRLEGERRAGGAALSVALVGPGRVTVGSAGDCVAVVLRGSRARVVGRPGPFLGDRPISGKGLVAHASLRTGGQLLLATDGVTEFLGRGWRRRVAELAEGAAPADLAGRLMEAAFRGGAGDNIAVVVARV